MFTYVCLLIVIPCVKIQTYIISKLVYGKLKPSHSTTGRWIWKHTLPNKAYCTDLGITGYCTEQHVLSHAWKGTWERPLVQKNAGPTLRANEEELWKQRRWQMCTLAFKSTAHLRKHKSQEYQGGALQERTGPGHGCLYSLKGFWSSSEAHQEPSEQLEGSS